jgi:hypothetical protein
VKREDAPRGHVLAQRAHGALVLEQCREEGHRRARAEETQGYLTVPLPAEAGTVTGGINTAERLPLLAVSGRDEQKDA